MTTVLPLQYSPWDPQYYRHFSPQLVTARILHLAAHLVFGQIPFGGGDYNAKNVYE